MHLYNWRKVMPLAVIASMGIMIMVYLPLTQDYSTTFLYGSKPPR